MNWVLWINVGNVGFCKPQTSWIFRFDGWKLQASSGCSFTIYLCSILFNNSFNSVLSTLCLVLLDLGMRTDWWVWEIVPCLLKGPDTPCWGRQWVSVAVVVRRPLSATYWPIEHVELAAEPVNHLGRFLIPNFVPPPLCQHHLQLFIWHILEPKVQTAATWCC